MSANDQLLLGAASDGQPLGQLLRLANRHGLVAGATGTGKTVTLQRLAEAFSDAGVAVFAADIKGDLCGLAAAGNPQGKIAERIAGTEQFALELGPAPVGTGLPSLLAFNGKRARARRQRGGEPPIAVQDPDIRAFQHGGLWPFVGPGGHGAGPVFATGADGLERVQRQVCMQGIRAACAAMVQGGIVCFHVNFDSC